jgi:hypothetical protein
MDCFSESYAEARGKFLIACAEAGAHVKSYPRHSLVGEGGEALATDVACLGPKTAQHAAIVICGTHGSESFSASAILTQWLAFGNGTPADIRLVLVHAINPWAFSHRTRADENNIDINRNFVAFDEGPAPDNPAYDTVIHILHGDPSDAARVLELHRAYKAYFDEHGWALEGQIWGDNGIGRTVLCTGAGSRVGQISLFAKSSESIYPAQTRSASLIGIQGLASLARLCT